ncbi:MAG: xanthine dehydrogenase accessory protein XdhC [Hyphomicrobiales bacterium]|nr:MAG: xanthine dehydrogenase accessory protein XdhC [Hyphomicrobiales bacterium]
MAQDLPTDLAALVRSLLSGLAAGPVVRIVVLRVDGSAPREAGAAMVVGAYNTWGTIGGGRLELEAIHQARAMLGATAEDPWQRDVRSFALGPSLGQCCGGNARLLFEMLSEQEIDELAPALPAETGDALVLRPTTSGTAPQVISHRKQDVAECPLPVMRVARDMLAGARPRQAELVTPSKSAAWFVEPASQTRTPLYIYGAGHVGRAIVHVLQDLPFDVRWVDTAGERFPVVPSYVHPIVASDPALVAADAPAGALHLVLTYSHALDLAIVHALLQRANFAFLGLIGSETKAARFRKRLREAGIADGALARMTCPIGVAGLAGKEPAVIAVAVAAQLLQIRQAAAAAVSGSVEASSA